MIEPRCEAQGCSFRATLHFDRAKDRKRVENRHFCNNHGQVFIAQCYNMPVKTGTGMPAQINEGVAFDIDFMFYDEAQDWSCQIYLVEVGGTRRIGLQTGCFEWSAIDLELQRYQSARPMTHHIIVSVMNALGGRLRHVIIDKFFPAHQLYEAKLVIQQMNTTTAVDVRPSDALVLALICETPIIVAHDVLSKLANGK